MASIAWLRHYGYPRGLKRPSSSEKGFWRPELERMSAGSGAITYLGQYKNLKLILSWDILNGPTNVLKR